MKVTKILEWDMGHRIPNHTSKCKNPHGHRYKIEVTLEGDLITTKGDSSQGMVIDFSDIKKILMQEIDAVCDHSFMYYKNDIVMHDFFKKNSELAHIAVPFIPTAENIAAWLFKKLHFQFKNTFKQKVQLVAVKLWETPTSASIVKKEDIENIE